MWKKALIDSYLSTKSRALVVIYSIPVLIGILIFCGALASYPLNAGKAFIISSLWTSPIWITMIALEIRYVMKFGPDTFPLGPYISTPMVIFGLFFVMDASFLTINVRYDQKPSIIATLHAAEKKSTLLKDQFIYYLVFQSPAQGTTNLKFDDETHIKINQEQFDALDPQKTRMIIEYKPGYFKIPWVISKKIVTQESNNQIITVTPE